MDVVFKEAWRRNDPEMEAQAKIFWEGLVPHAERERRVKELCCMAYDGDRLVGLSTAYPSEFPQVKARLAAYRCAVAPDFRRHELAKLLTSHSIAILKRWSEENPQERVLGLAAVIQAAELSGMAARPSWTEYDLNLNLACYMPTGEQLRVAWFPHAQVAPSRGAPAPARAFS